MSHPHLLINAALNLSTSRLERVDDTFSGYALVMLCNDGIYRIVTRRKDRSLHLLLAKDVGQSLVDELATLLGGLVRVKFVAVR